MYAQQDDTVKQNMLSLPSGVPRVILARLLFGLGGCALICAIFPFIIDSARQAPLSPSRRLL